MDRAQPCGRQSRDRAVSSALVFGGHATTQCCAKVDDTTMARDTPRKPRERDLVPKSRAESALFGLRMAYAQPRERHAVEDRGADT